MTVRDSTLRRWGRVLAGAAVLIGCGGLAVALIAAPRLLIDYFDLNIAGVLGVGLGAVAWVTISRQPRNGAIWTFAVAGLFASLQAASDLALMLLARRLVPGFVISSSADLSMSDLPTSAALAGFPGMWAYVPAYFLPITLGFMLFPDGRAPSRRWRWLGWYVVVAIVVVSAASGWVFRPTSTLPISTLLDDLPGTIGSIAGNGIYLLVVGAVATTVALVVRYRRAAGVQRRQIRWIAWGGSFMLVAVVAAFSSGLVISGNVEARDTLVDDVLYLVGEIVLILSFAMAITRYRLYDIDVVISKTVAYTALAIVIAAVYGAAVLSFIYLVGDPARQGGDLGLALPLAATAVVAILFEPLRGRLQRWANRLVYGERAAPHEVLSRLTSQLGDTSAGGGLVGLAELIRQGTGAESVAVWLQVGGRLRLEATSPTTASPAHSRVASIGDLPRSEWEASAAVRHGDELLGALGITKPHAHPVTGADESLLADVAAGAGLLLRNLQLQAELAERAEQLRASRRRLIAAHDAARHRLERDLHDGAQQQVVALKVRLGLARAIAEREGATAVAGRVADLAEQTQEAVDSMRAVARGIYPPLLEAEGLGPALAAAQRTSDLPVHIDSGGLPRFSRQVEETVYFCVLAAVARARMAGATSARVGAEGAGTSLVVTVAYDAADRGDLSPITDRIDAFGGAVTTTPAPGGTTLTLALPVVGEVMTSQ